MANIFSFLVEICSFGKVIVTELSCEIEMPQSALYIFFFQAFWKFIEVNFRQLKKKVQH